MSMNPIAPVLEFAIDSEQKLVSTNIDDSQIDSYIEACEYNPNNIDQEVTCNQCGAFFDSQANLTEHLSKFHANSSMLNDETSQLNNNEKGERSQHFRIHSGKKLYQCTFCSKSFSRSVSLKTHLKTHSDDEPYKCTSCDMGFSQNSDLTRHMRSHNDKTPQRFLSLDRHVTPTLVDKTAVNNQIITIENEANGELETLLTEIKLYKCEICSKGYTTKAGLQYHIDAHKNEKRFSCEICHKRFNHDKNVKIHMRIHRSDRPYVCSACNKNFKSKQELKRHFRIHLGERPFQCTICSKSFGQSSKLQVHRMVHNGEKPYECTICNKSYSYKSRLKAHILKHSGERPYSCSVCDVSYGNKFALKRHMNLHHDERKHEVDSLKTEIIQGHSVISSIKSLDDDNMEPMMDCKIEIEYPPVKHEIEIKEEICDDGV